MRRTGILLKLNTKLQLSIQTDPNTAGDSFAETALLYKKVIYDTSLGYNDVKRFYTPEKLFEHLNYLFEEMKIRGADYYYIDDTDNDDKDIDDTDNDDKDNDDTDNDDKDIDDKEKKQISEESIEQTKIPTDNELDNMDLVTMVQSVMNLLQKSKK